jgi:Peptidase_C39 like family
MSLIRSTLAFAVSVVLLFNSGTVFAQTADLPKACLDKKITTPAACTRHLHSIGVYFVGAGSLGGGSSCTGSFNVNDALLLTYPNYPNEDEVAQKFEDFVREKRPTSPWLTVANLGKRLVEDGKKHNVNPFLTLTSGKTESAFGTTGSHIDNFNYFGIDNGEKEFASVEDGLFGEEALLPDVNRKLREHSNYKEVKNLYEYLSVHNTGQILYPGMKVYIYIPHDGVYVSSEGDTGYGPVEYWRNAMNDYNNIFGTSLPTDPPSRTGNSSPTSGGSCSSSYPPGSGGWDLPGEGSNPMAYYSQLYACDETPPEGRNKTCDEAVGDNAFGSLAYGSGTIEKCGCGPVSYAMAVTTLTGKQTLPETVARWSEQNGGVVGEGCGSNWFWNFPVAEGQFGIVSTQIETSEIVTNLRAGKLVIVSLSAFPTEDSSVGHISLIRKVDDSGNIYFADSYSGGWGGGEGEGGASRKPFREEQLAGMLKGSWALSPSEVAR